MLHFNRIPLNALDRDWRTTGFIKISLLSSWNCSSVRYFPAVFQILCCKRFRFMTLLWFNRESTWQIICRTWLERLLNILIFNCSEKWRSIASEDRFYGILWNEIFRNLFHLISWICSFQFRISSIESDFYEFKFIVWLILINFSDFKHKCN